MDSEMLARLRIAEQCQRYEDMGKIFHHLPLTQELTEEERAFFSTAYKNILTARRTAWRALSAYEVRLQQANNIEEGDTIAWYRSKIQKEIRDIVGDVLRMLDQLLKVSGAESRIFCLRMRGDVFRYLSEITKEQELKFNQESAVRAYEEALKVCQEISLSKTSSLKLGVSLNLSVLYFQIVGNVQRAIQVCEKAFNEASDKLNDISEQEFKDTTTIMQLMYDNLTQWKAETVTLNK